MGELHGMFSPDRVAIVGATERPGSVGSAVTRNLLNAFDGEVVPVNPNADSVFGIEALDSVADAGLPDLVVITVPPEIALSVLEECGESGVDNIVVITAGFGESGSEGATREHHLIELANRYDLNLVGPNSLGIMRASSGLNATFGPEDASPGQLSFMSQSGAFVTAVVDWANDRHLGFRDIVSLGNKAILDETDFLEAWGDDPDTHVIVGYLEGIDDGQTFIATARKVTKKTPVVLVKSGRTEAGVKAASSHTGTLAGSDDAYEAGLQQAGILRADTVQELFDTAEILSGQPLPVTAGAVVITNAGGPGVMATDALGNASLSMAEFSSETRERLRDELPEGASIQNPVDILGDADAERFRETLAIAMDDEAVGAIVVISCPTAVLEYEELARLIVDANSGSKLPIATCLMGGNRVRGPAERLNQAGIPCYFDPSRAVRSLDGLARYAEIRETEPESPETFEVDRERARDVLSGVHNRENNRLGVESMGILEAYGISIPDGRIVRSAERARRAAEEIGGEVAMKVVSPQIIHKTDIGAVKIGVDPEDVENAYEEIVTLTRNYQSDATILGVQIQQMIDIDAGVETIIGVNRDPQFGPLLMFGLGGIFVEVLEDTTFRIAPITERDAREMTTELGSASLLRGVRGREPVDLGGIVDALQRLSQLSTDFPAINELDINPLVATSDGVLALDLRLTVTPENL